MITLADGCLMAVGVISLFLRRRRPVFHSVPPAAKLTEGNERELRALCRAAVDCFKDDDDRIFTTACFRQVVKEAYGLSGTPGGKWATDTLKGLPFVEQLNRDCVYWRLRG